MRVQGRIKVGCRTKELVNYLLPDDIAIIKHDDIDEIAAFALAHSGTKAIINTGRTMTGRFDPKGAATLLNNQVPIFDTSLDINCFQDNEILTVMDNDIIYNSCIYKGVCSAVNWEYVRKRKSEAENNEKNEAISFLENTIQHAADEISSIVYFSDYPKLLTRLEGRHAVVVTRNYSSIEELLVLDDYIEKFKPLFIGVDGGADIITSCGYVPDILIGDMDSVSDIGIYKSREVILHTYRNGYCPCLQRIKPMNIPYKTIGIPGTSEDAALMLAYRNNAELIVLVGGHSCMKDFMAKGRQGMASTFITRTLIGEKLLDCKGLGYVSACKGEGKGLLWAKV